MEKLKFRILSAKSARVRRAKALKEYITVLISLAAQVGDVVVLSEAADILTKGVLKTEIIMEEDGNDEDSVRE